MKSLISSTIKYQIAIKKQALKIDEDFTNIHLIYKLLLLFIIVD